MSSETFLLHLPQYMMVMYQYLEAPIFILISFLIFKKKEEIMTKKTMYIICWTYIILSIPFIQHYYLWGVKWIPQILSTKLISGIRPANSNSLHEIITIKYFSIIPHLLLFLECLLFTYIFKKIRKDKIEYINTKIRSEQLFVIIFIIYMIIVIIAPILFLLGLNLYYIPTCVLVAVSTWDFENFNLGWTLADYLVTYRVLFPFLLSLISLRILSKVKKVYTN